MHLHLKPVSFLSEKQSALVVTVGPELQMDSAAERMNEFSDGALLRILQDSGFEGKAGQTLPLYTLPGLPCEWLILAGRGPSHEFRRSTLIKVIQASCTALKDLKRRSATLALFDLCPADLNPLEAFTLSARLTLESSYQFLEWKSKPTPSVALHDLHFIISDKSLMTSCKQALDWAQAVTAGVTLCRNVGNQPANRCTPSWLAEQALLLGKSSKKLKVKVLGEAQLEKLGAGAFLAVTRGSEEEGKLILLEYRGAAAARSKSVDVALVGKGITFDSGGISIKPAASMDEMKFDMCGAATVLGVMQTLIRAELPVNVVGVLACAENMPSGKATRPGDIVTTLSGKTVEILNTDAEGRLVLCDALTYTLQHYQPEKIIDIATLTGACVVALGKVTTGLFSDDDLLAEELTEAGRLAQDPAWRLPLGGDYQELLDSPCADMANIGGPTAGAITAASFLSRFTEGSRWAHLDIAGTAWISGAKKTATGRPVPLLTEFLKRQTHA